MHQIEVGKNKMNISMMGLGTWAIGGGPAWNGDLDTQVCIDTICEAVKVGVNLIDTAPGYNFGNSEVIVGKALKQLDRKDVIIETKCGIVWGREGSLFNKVGDIQLYKNLSTESILEEVEQSLERLGTDYIDIYMTHWQSVPPFLTPIAETMEVLNSLKSKGVIRAIGAANVDVGHIKEYLKYGELDIIQAKYNILDRGVENDLIPVCLENDIVLQAYSPLEQGLLTGTIARDYIPTGARANKKWFQKEHLGDVITMMDKWQPLCEKYGCSIPTLALAWIMGQNDKITLLTGATSVEQVHENIKAANLNIDAEDLTYMRDLAEQL